MVEKVKVRYEWTGEYRKPKEGEWYFGTWMTVLFTPVEAAYDMRDDCFILRRVDESEGEDE